MAGRELTLQQLEPKFDRFQRDMPTHTKAGLKRGTKVLLQEMRRRYTASGLHRRSGDLYRAIKVLNIERAGKKVAAAVGVADKQVYKATAHEMGLTVGHGVVLPRRAFVEPTRRAKLQQVKEILLDELIAGYRKSG